MGSNNPRRQPSDAHCSRRKALGLAGAGLFAASGFGAVTAAPKKSHEWDNFYQTVMEKYGEQEAKVTRDIVKYHYGNKILSERERFRAITDDILNHPHTTEGSRDLRNVLETFGEVDSYPETNTNSGNGDLSTQDNTCYDCGGGGTSYTINVDNGSTEINEAYGAVAHSKSVPSNNNERVYVQTGLYGAGYGRARLWGTYYVASDTTADVTARYFRRAYINGAELQISIGVRPSYGGWNFQEIEDLVSPAESQETYTKSFTLNGGYNYDIGVEVIAQGSSASVEGDTSDLYYKNNVDKLRHLHIGELSIVEY